MDLDQRSEISEVGCFGDGGVRVGGSRGMVQFAFFGFRAFRQRRSRLPSRAGCVFRRLRARSVQRRWTEYAILLVRGVRRVAGYLGSRPRKVQRFRRDRFG